MTFPRTKSYLGRYVYKEDLRRDLERLLEEIDISTGAGIIEQPEFHVNSITGSDKNSGASDTTPIQSLSELDKRLGEGIINKFTPIFLTGDFRTEVLSIKACSSFDTSLTTLWPMAILGQPTTLYSGTITATSNQAIPSAAPPNITDPAVVNWTTAGPGGSSLLRKRLRITNAPADPSDVGKIMWLKRDEGGGVVSTSYPEMLDDPMNNTISFPSMGGLVNPPYDYVIEELVRVGGILHGPNGPARLNIQNIGGPDLGIPSLIQANGGFPDKVVSFSGCDLEFHMMTNGIISALGCRLLDLNAFGTLAIILSSLIDGGPIQNSMRQLFLGGNTLSIDNNLYVGSTLASSSAFCGLILSGASAFDAPGDAIDLQIGSTMHAFGAGISGTLHGTGNSTGVKVGPNSTFSYDTVKSLPDITGATEVLVGSVATTWAAIDGAGGLIELAPPTLARVVRT